MKRASLILRLISLALLFGGSSAIVFAAIILVKAAQAHGIAITEAATANAPIFISYAKVALGAGFALLIAEALDYAARQKITKLTLLRYTSSILCIIATIIFSLGLTPAMEQLLVELNGIHPAQAINNAQSIFHHLHHIARIVFGGVIVFALASLIFSGCGEKN